MQQRLVNLDSKNRRINGHSIQTIVMKFSFSILVFLAIISGCTKPDIIPLKSCPQISITVSNESGAHLDEFIVYDSHTGPLMNGEIITVCLDEIDGYRADDVYIYMGGRVGNFTIKPSYPWCGAGIIPITQGEYKLRIYGWEHGYFNYEYD